MLGFLTFSLRANLGDSIGNGRAGLRESSGLRAGSGSRSNASTVFCLVGLMSALSSAIGTGFAGSELICSELA